MTRGTCEKPAASSFSFSYVGNILIRSPRCLASTEQELHILGCQLVEGNLIIVDSAVDHVGLLLLQQNHPGFNRVFNDKAGDDTRTTLPNSVATVG